MNTANQANPSLPAPPTIKSWPRLFGSATGLLSAGWLVLLGILSVTATLWRPYSPNAQDLDSRFQLPSWNHWLGTDELGRDILTRIFSASGPALLAAALSIVVAFAIAIPLVLAASEHTGWTEKLTSRSTEIVMALPMTIILLSLIGAVGGSRIYVIMATLGAMMSAAVYRTLLGVAQSLHGRLYIDAARVDGVGPVRIGLRYVLPGMLPVTVVQATQMFAAALLVESGLAFMGFGPAQPTPSWGGMVATASQYIYQDAWLMVPAGATLALTVLAANTLGDALAGSPKAPRIPRLIRRTFETGAPVPEVPAISGALLQVESLTLRITDGPTLVSDVSFALTPGTILGLVGESGCGKTLTALALPGLVPPGVTRAAGSVRLDGRELASLSERRLQSIRGRDIALIPQDPMSSLDPLFTIGFQIGAQIRRLRRIGRRAAAEVAAELLGRAGIPDPTRVLKARPHELSGGIAQRVMIAMALAGSPRLLIADEPTTALDVTVQAEILDVLRGLAQNSGVSVIIVSHDIGVIADLCDEVVVMYAGQIVEHGTTADVLTEPGHPYTAALLAASPHLAGGHINPGSLDPAGSRLPVRLLTIPGNVPIPGNWPNGCRFAPRCRFADEKCKIPIELTTHGGTTIARCIKTKEIHELR